MIKSTTLVPAYGRDYTTAKAVRNAWNDDKDFIIADFFDRGDGRLINCSDAVNSGMKRVGIRYARLTKQVFIAVKPSKPSMQVDDPLVARVKRTKAEIGE